MPVFKVDVSIRKGRGPEWFRKEFEVVLDDLELELPEDELVEWAKDEVREKLKTANEYNHYGDNWIITDVVKT